MKRLFCLLTVAIAILLVCSGAQAVVIDFEEFNDGDAVGTTSGPLTTQGFSFHYIGYGDYQRIKDVGGNNIVVDWTETNLLGAETRMFADMGSFMLNSFEYGDYDGAGSGVYAIHVRAYGAMGEYAHLELNPTTAGNILTAADLGMTGVWLNELRINLVSNSVFGNFYFDNVDVDPVPEPTTLLLLSSGLIALAGARRKAKK